MAGIQDVARTAGVKTDVVVDVFEAVYSLVKAGKTVRISGFGSFEKKKFPGRTLSSPVINDGKPTTFGSKSRMAFRQSDQIKRRLNAKRKKKVSKKPIQKKRKVRNGV
jgi:nucleoid DNA-binding protein